MSDEGRILGIDYGSRRIGLAVSDPLRTVARGIETIQNDSSCLARLEEIIRREQIVLIVVGMPYAPDGGRGSQAREVEQFVTLLRGRIEVAVETWDESFSSQQAQALLRQGGMRRKRRAEKGRIDEMAARILLQEYMEYRQNRPAE